MSTLVRYLDRERVARVTPSEGDARHTFLLSPYAIPHGIELHLYAARGSRIVFLYHDNLEPPAPPAPLDADQAMPIDVTTAVHSRKVLALTSPREIHPTDLPLIAERLRRAALTRERPAERMSFQLTAEVLPMVVDDMLRAGSRPIMGE